MKLFADQYTAPSFSSLHHAAPSQNFLVFNVFERGSTMNDTNDQCS